MEKDIDPQNQRCFFIFDVVRNRKGKHKQDVNTDMIMNDIMDFWRSEWDAVADTSEVTGAEDMLQQANRPKWKCYRRA